MGSELLTVHEVSLLTGVSARTLHYYDSIGLLRPDSVSGSGYRLYGSTALSRLQEIMFLRELEFPLREIRDMLASPSYDRTAALSGQRELLMLKAKRTQALIQLIDGALSDKKVLFGGFSMDELNKARDKYREEAKKRWGNTPQYAASEEHEASRTAEQSAAMDADAEDIFRAFAALAAAGANPAGDEARALVERWQAHITKNHFDCTIPILKGLGLMYTADERFKKNLDLYGEGTAELMSAAIGAY